MFSEVEWLDGKERAHEEPHARQRLKKKVYKRTGIIPVSLGQMILFFKHL